MSLAIIKQERVVRFLPLVSLGALCISLLLAYPLQKILGLDESLSGIGSEYRNRAADVYPMVAFVAVQMCIFVIALLPLRTRVHDHELALPISMRVLVRGRLAVTLATLAVIVASSSLLFFALGSTRATPMLIAVGTCTSAAVTAVLLAYAWRPSAPRLSYGELGALLGIGLALLALPGVLGEMRLGLVYLLISVALAVWIHRSVPVTAASPVSRRRASVHAEGQPLWSRFLSPLRWTLLRSAVLRPLPCLGLVSVALVVPFAGHGNLAFMFWFPGFFACMSANFGLALLHGIDSLPFSRTRLLPYLALPSLLALTLGFGLIPVVPLEYGSYDPLTRRVQVSRMRGKALGIETEYRVHVRVPSSAWVIARDPEDARVTSPWGEVCDPTPHPLFWGAESFAYNPYDAGSSNSVRFLAWQASRALRDIHQLEYTPEELYELFVGRVDGLELTPVEDPPSPPSRALDDSIGGPRHWAPARLPWLELPDSLPRASGSWLLFALATWILAVGYALRPNIPRSSRTARVHARLRRFIVPALVFALLLIALLLNGQDRSLLPILGARFHLHLDGLLGSSAAAWVALDLSVAAAGYLFMRYRIQRIEVGPLPKAGFAKTDVGIY